MDFHKTLERLHASKEYKSWKEKHSGFYLAHAFVMQDEANKGILQIGYFNAKKDRMATFIVSPDTISVTQEQEVMKAEQCISELDVEKIKLTVEEAISAAKKCIDENYAREMILKSFFIIQEIAGIPMFNITYLTQGFKTINIKINATDGTIVKHSSGVIAQFS